MLQYDVMVNPIHTIRQTFRDLPDKKKYIEVITASLSIPVLLSVVLMNYLNIQEKRKIETTPIEIVTPVSQAPQVITIIRDRETDTAPISTPTTDPNASPTETVNITQAECIKKIGPVSIASPKNNSTVTSNPLEIFIEYDQGDYCSVVWSYRINNDSWSDYSDNNIVIYNMESGDKTLEVRVKSITSKDEKILTQKFTYTNPSVTSIATPTVTPSQTI